MEYRRLGRSGLEVSLLCLGTMTFGDRTDAAEAKRIVDAAFDAGVNFVDTADMYNAGESERMVGEAIRANRRRWIVATKVANPRVGRPHDGGLSRRWMFIACDDSLARLRTDWIDVYYLHKDDQVTPIAETVRAMGDLIASGKVRYFGVSNFRAWRIAEVLRECDRQGVAHPVVCQPYYNLLNRQPEVEILPMCDYHGIGVAPYSPAARGVLTGKYGPDGAIPENSRGSRKDKRFLETDYRPESFAIAEELAAHARATGRTLLQFALAWLFSNRIVSSVIAGPRTLEQWQQYAAALGTPWLPGDDAVVDARVPPGYPSTFGFHDPQYPFFGRRLA